jgi:hypothetical protein
MASTPQKTFQRPLGATHVQDMPISNPNNVAAVYANNFGISATMTDFTIYFLELVQIPGSKSPAQKQEVRAIVTLPMLAAGGLQQITQQIVQQAADALKQMKTATTAEAASGGKE